MQTVGTKNSVLNREAISRKMRRIALEVAEQNITEQSLILAGIAGNGSVVARALEKELKKISSIKTEFITVQLNKKDPLEASFDRSIDLESRVVILIDDVADTGRTMLYALKPFLNAHPKKIQTMVLVERSHKLFPIHTDYTGLSITTTLQEHITVETEGEEITGAWLF